MDGVEVQPRKPMVGVREAARQLGVSEYLVRALHHRGELAAVRLGRLMRFEQGEIDRFVEARRRRVEV